MRSSRGDPEPFLSGRPRRWLHWAAFSAISLAAVLIGRAWFVVPLLAVILAVHALASLLWRRFRKTNEGALRASQERYESLVRHMNSGIAVYGARGNGEDFVCLDFNPAAERIDDIDKAAVLGRSLAAVFPGVKEFGLWNVLQRVWRTGEAEFFPATKYRDGRICGWRENYVYKLPTGEVVAVYDDVTERKGAEEALRGANDSLGALINASPLAIITLDPSGRVTAWNPAAERMFGWSAAEALGRIPPFVPEDKHEEFARIRDSILGGGAVAEKELRRRKKDGTPIEVVLFTAPLRDPQGKISGIMAAIADVTERKKADEEIRRRADELSALNVFGLRVGAIRSFEGVISAALAEMAAVTQSNLGFFFGKKNDRLELHSVFPEEGAQDWRGAPALCGADCLCGLAAEQGRPVFSIRMTTDARCTRPQCRRAGFESFAALPLLRGKDLIGVIGLASRAEHDYEAQADFLGALVHEASIALEGARLFGELKASVERLRQLSNYQQTAREEERAHIAREIHDEFGQSLTALKIDLSWLLSRLPASAPTLGEKTEDMIGLVDGSIRMVRRIASELRPSVLDDLGLVAAIEWQAEEFSKRTGIACELRLKCPDLVLGRDPAIAVFRVFQESLTNAARHAETDRITVSLANARERIRLTVRDYGRGISPAKSESQTSMGLIGMRERARALGGTVSIRGRKGTGTTVSLTIPLPGAEGAQP